MDKRDMPFEGGGGVRYFRPDRRGCTQLAVLKNLGLCIGSMSEGVESERKLECVSDREEKSWM